MVIRGQGPVLRLAATWNFEKRMRLLYQKNSIIFLSACQLLLVLIIGFGGLLSDSVAAAPRVDRVAVIFQEKLSQHQQVVGLLQARFKETAEIDLQLLPINGELSQTQLAQLPASDFLVAIGSRALGLALEKGGERPGLYVLASEPELLKLASNSGRWQGLAFTVPFKTQLGVIKELLPEVRRLALVYGQGQQDQVLAFRRAADELGFEVDISMVTKRNSFVVIDRLYRRCDLFFMMPIPGLINRVTLQKMFELQARTRRPLVGLSANFVKLGALLSINYTLEAVGDYLVGELRDLAVKGQLTDLVVSDKKFPENLYTVFLNPKRAALLSVEIKSNLKERVVLVDVGGAR